MISIFNMVYLSCSMSVKLEVRIIPHHLRINIYYTLKYTFEG